MKKIWFLFYNVLIIPALYAALNVMGIFNAKVRRGLKGRKRIFENIVIDAATLNKSKKLIWFHSSSLGEFEQAKPIIEELKERKDINILVTFFLLRVMKIQKNIHMQILFPIFLLIQFLKLKIL